MAKEIRKNMTMAAAVIAAFVLLTCGFSVEASAASAVSVYVDDIPVAWTDAYPYIDGNDRTMVPLRQIANVMEMDVSWDGATQTAQFVKTYDNERECPDEYGYASSVTIRFHIGSAVAEVYTDNGFYDEVVMDTTAVVRNGRTFAPIRYLAEAAGYEVKWEGNSQTVSLYSEERQFFEALSSPIQISSCTEEELADILLSANKAGLTSVSIEFDNSMAYSDLVGLVQETVETSFNQTPQYGYYTENYRLRTSLGFNNQTITISWSEAGGGYSKRQEAFEAGAALLSQLYHEGRLQPTMSERERARVILNAICSRSTGNTDTDGYLAHTAWASLVEHYGVCSSKTGAYNMLLTMDGIKCWGQDGYTYGQYHLWTGCVLDGKTVYTDATIHSDTNFALTRAELSKTHVFA